MAYRTILAVNFDEERLRLLKHVGLTAQAKVRAVGEDEKDKTVGELIGLTEEETAEISALAQDTIEGTAIPDDAEPVMKEAVILCGFDQAAAHEFLEAIKRGKVKYIPLKAMLTPNNVGWNIHTILYELQEEHEYFKKNRSR
ncbi:DUF3783 domain-containing protein [Megasphaera coli]|uniref:DUF3783 domain-containing protein n=1 Tax=Colibacter massiliensis TaxID=1852379 RepID=UPI00094F2359|nr:DUF3783 domain-containing protein [Colibacter massiliensis]